MIKLVIASDLRNVLRPAPHTQNFLKEKKRKKRKSSFKWRFQEKQVFSRKYYPAFYDRDVRKWGFEFNQMLKRNENVGWRFY